MGVDYFDNLFYSIILEKSFSTYFTNWGFVS